MTPSIGSCLRESIGGRKVSGCFRASCKANPPPREKKRPGADGTGWGTSIQKSKMGQNLWLLAAKAPTRNPHSDFCFGGSPLSHDTPHAGTPALFTVLDYVPFPQGPNQAGLGRIRGVGEWSPTPLESEHFYHKRVDSLRGEPPALLHSDDVPGPDYPPPTHTSPCVDEGGLCLPTHQPLPFSPRPPPQPQSGTPPPN